MASFQGTQPSKMNKRGSTLGFIEAYRSLPLGVIFFFSDNMLADVASKQQTTVLFLSAIVTRTRKRTELTKTLTNLMGNLCCAREHSIQFFVQFFYTVKLHSLT
jgi:hypothetical protein